MIEVKNLEVTYEGNAAPGGEECFLHRRAGNVLFAGRPSGCGKTTTLRSIAGLETPDAGEIRLGATLVFSDASRINVPAHKRGVGMVFQSYAIWPHMTVSENVAFPLTTGGPQLSKQKIAQRVGQALALVGLSAFGERAATRLVGRPADSGSRSRGRSCANRRCCCSMSRCLIWMQNCASTCAPNCAAFKSRPASPHFMSPTTRRRPYRCRTASPS